MTANAASGHPGGSLSSVDFLSLLYTFIISQTGEPVIVSNGHISPAVYAVLSELGFVSKKNVLSTFRRFNSLFEGHVARHVPGVWYSTGPLGTGISAASGFALAEQLRGTKKKVFAILGDGESEEGQVYEMMNFSSKCQLSNLIVFMDYNRVQLSDSVKNIIPINPKKLFTAAGWTVIEVHGHDYQAMWSALRNAYSVQNTPVLLLGKTIMGKGVVGMENDGKKLKATWHGKAPTILEAQNMLETISLTREQQQLIMEFKKEQVRWKPKKVIIPKPLSRVKMNTGKPIVYQPGELTDCRTAYGKALLDLAKQNSQVIALTADVAESVKTSFVKDERPLQHIECGIAEQQMVSCAGGLSLAGYVPFASTFGAFMTSRAKDQARVNDLNQTNVKMVATHCGLSVGEDGPTHQAIDDLGSMLGLFNTMVIEPADPNQTDRIIRYAASRYGNFYVRMGRHKIPVLTKEDGTIFFDEEYEYYYGRCDVLRSGTDITIAATGATVIEALQAYEELRTGGVSAEIVIVSSIKQFDALLIESIQKTKRLLTVEDHNTYSGLGSQLAYHLQLSQVLVNQFSMLGVDTYQSSGTARELYQAAGIDSGGIVKKVREMMAK